MPTKSEFPSLYLAAHRAGTIAGEALNPVPMIVEEHAQPMNDSSPVVKSWYVPQGVCGFAWVTLPGRTAFAKYLVSEGVGRKGDSYSPGVKVWVRGFGQSYEKKSAYAAAFAGVLANAGIVGVYPGGRLD